MEIPGEGKKREVRFTKRCEIEFSSDSVTRRGISSNLSLNGLFIRTDLPFFPDTILDIVIYLPDGSISVLKGRVTRSSKTSLGKVMGTHLKNFKNGMGIEIINRDINYQNFMNSLLREA